jgi:hypothetical protein
MTKALVLLRVKVQKSNRMDVLWLEKEMHIHHPTYDIQFQIGDNFSLLFNISYTVFRENQDRIFVVCGELHFMMEEEFNDFLKAGWTVQTKSHGLNNHETLCC